MRDWISNFFPFLPWEPNTPNHITSFLVSFVLPSSFPFSFLSLHFAKPNNALIFLAFIWIPHTNSIFFCPPHTTTPRRPALFVDQIQDKTNISKYISEIQLKLETGIICQVIPVRQKYKLAPFSRCTFFFSFFEKLLKMNLRYY